MRLGWSVLCRDFEQHEDGTVTLKEVFADSVLRIEIAEPPPLQASLNPPVILLSYWFRESESDKRRYPAVLRILSPDDNQTLAEWHFGIDFMLSDGRFTRFQLDELEFVGAGLYELHIEVLEFGEWNLLSRNGILVSDTLS